jgi:hypothetical protein
MRVLQTTERWLAALAVACSAWLVTADAAAQDTAGTPRSPSKETSPIVVGPDADAKGPVVAAEDARGYDEEPPVDGADVALFVPRAVLFVPRWTLWALFYPFNATLGFLDEHKVIEHVEDVLYNDERTAGIVPTFSADTVLGPTVGARAFHDDLAGHGEKGSIKASFGGRFEQAYEVSFKADRTGGTPLWLESTTRFDREPSLRFYGLGDRPTTDQLGDPRGEPIEAYYRHQRLMWLNRAGYTFGEPGGMVKLGGSTRFTNHDYGASTDKEPLIDTVYDTSKLVGFDDGYSLIELDANLVIDFRDVTGATSSGFYFAAFGGGVPTIRSAYSFGHWGAEAVGYFPLFRTYRVNEARVLILRAFFESVDGDEADIPFNELPRLGGARRLRGYPLDRFRDKKSYVGTIEYHYPIHQFVGGALFFDAGRVAREYADLADDVPRFGGGFGFNIRTRDRQLFSLQAAYGDGFHVYFSSDPLRAFAAEEDEL